MVMHDKLSTTEKNAAALLAISMAMRIRRYGAERIAQYAGRSRATLLEEFGSAGSSLF
jgi:hypothetical protein